MAECEGFSRGGGVLAGAVGGRIAPNGAPGSVHGRSQRDGSTESVSGSQVPLLGFGSPGAQRRTSDVGPGVAILGYALAR